MPIRVECPRCHKVTYFADNDAGLAVACLACKTHLKVPIPHAAPKPVSPMVHPDEPPPLFSNTPKHLLVAPPSTKPAAVETPRHHAGKARPVRPASPRSRWRLYGIFILLGVIGIALAALNKYLQDNSGGTQAHDTQSTQPASKPISAATRPAAQIAKVPAPATTPIVVAPPPDKPPIVKPPIVASITPAPVAPQATPAKIYTPAGAPVGLVGVDRIELGGKTQIDSYNAAVAPYTKESAQANAALLSNGVIQLNVEGQIRAAVHSGLATPIKPGKKLTIIGPTDPLTAPLLAPMVELDPLSHDSANASLPVEYVRNGNFNLDGKKSAKLPGGVYYVNDFVIVATATLHLEGPATFLVSGQVSLIGKIETHDQRPANCRIRLTSDKPVTITHTNNLYLDLYAPQSPIRIDGKGDLYGSIVGRTLTVNGSRNFHVDESLQQR
jgi:hypothetical protein